VSWSENCHLVGYALRHGSKHNPMSQFQHLNLIHVNTKNHIPFCAFKSFPGLYLFAILRPVITILHFEPAGVRAGLPCWVVWGQSTLLPPVILRLEVCKFAIVYCQSTVHLSLFLLFTVTFKYPVSLQRHFPEYCVLRLQPTRTCIANSTCLQQTASCPLDRGIIKLYHSFCTLNCVSNHWKKLIIEP